MCIMQIKQIKTNLSTFIELDHSHHCDFMVLFFHSFIFCFRMKFVDLHVYFFQFGAKLFFSFQIKQ